MIISKTPIRISFLGGGTDYPEYFERCPGAVLGTAINKYAYINIQEAHPFFDYRYRVSYKEAEVVDTIEEIQHPSVKACLKYLNFKERMEIHYQGDWPARTGMGSSSSFTVGLLNALFAFKNNQLPKEHLSKEAIHVEREIIKERVGWQDQIWASFGGMAKIEFYKNDFNYVPLSISKRRKKEIQNHLLLFFTGVKRIANNILPEQIEKTKSKNNDEYLKEMYQLVQEGEEILTNGAVSEFGKVLHENWLIKKSLSSKISNGDIDDAYDVALRNGAIGGKLLGAGAGGFLLLFAAPQYHRKIIESLNNLTYVEFDFEPYGSRIIFNGN